MKRNINLIVVSILLIATLILGVSAGSRQSTSNTNELIIWTSDSFISSWGPGPAVAERFEELTGIRIIWEGHSGAGTMLSRLLHEGSSADADIILGIDQNMAGRLLESGLLESYRPIGAERIFPELIFDPSFRLIPMDYSYFAFVYDSETITNPPRSLEDLTRPEYRDGIVLIDPRTSSVGLGLFGWVKEVYGEGWRDYWRRLSPSILTVSGGWSAAYGLFTRGEAPLVLSYTTSPGYHLEFEDSERFKAAIFPGGHPLQIEAGGLVRAGGNKENARRFMDFMISPDFQDIIPLTNWTYPVIDIPLPDSFRINPKSDISFIAPPVSEAELNEWASLMAVR
ncbi:MAG: thiamine ABC transporter substrate-binding protein [Treponema sp.]|nr:thiamine ABC transporter substrate-binding protein [Treponema sp.]